MIALINMSKTKEERQLSLPFKIRGGFRKGAGRKPSGRAVGVPHRTRARHAPRHPVHITIKRAQGLPAMRTRSALKVLRRAFAAGCNRFGFRLIHYSIQNTHIHMVVEAKDRLSLTRGMKGLTVRIARGLNRVWGRKGQVFPDRYHERVLCSPRQVRWALRYVLLNARKHGVGPVRGLDHFASGWWFDGWREELEIVGLEAVERPVARARTWLLGTGWRRHGAISIDAVPGPKP